MTNTGTFRPGCRPWNKGLTYHAGGRSVAAQFKPGNTPHNMLPLGTEHVDSYGVLLRKVADTRVRRVDWRPVKDLNWEAAHGPVPAGHIIVCADRDASNVQLSNLLCVTRAENMHRNSIHRHGREFVAAVKRAEWQQRKKRIPPFARYVLLVAGV